MHEPHRFNANIEFCCEDCKASYRLSVELSQFWLRSQQYFDRMKSFDFLIMPALLGLVAGVAHGVIAHQAELPLGLMEQLHQVVEGEHISLQ